MKKYLGIMFAALLCVSCLGFAACGSSSSSSGQSGEENAASSAPAAETSSAVEPAAPAADTSAEPAAPATDTSAEPAAPAKDTSSEPAAPAAAKADPSEKFVGSWKLAALELDGITVTGNLEQVEWASSTLEIAADGTGKIGLNDETYPFTWKATDDGAIEIESNADDEDASMLTEARITCDENGTLAFNMVQNDTEGTLFYTNDGTYKDARVISGENAKPIKSADEVAGTWTLSGMSMNGASMYGEPEALAAIATYDDVSLVFNEDGTASFCGNDVEWSLSDEGLTLGDATGQYPVKTLGKEGIILDLSEIAGTDFILLFTK